MKPELIGPTSKRDKAGSVLCDFKCVCGSIFQTRKYDVRVGRTKSCGCLKKILAAENGKRGGYKDRTLSSFNALFLAYNIAAKKRKLVFELSKEVFRGMTKQNCFYCEIVPSQKRVGSGAKDGYVYNGIDRIENEKGYTENNCVPCCGICNKMKLTLSHDSFIEHIKRIAKRFT